MSITFTADNAPADLEVNVCNSNAADILRTLGLPIVPEGSIGGADLAARLSKAIVADPQQAIPAVREGHWVTGGRSADYMRRTLTALSALAWRYERVWWG